MREAWPRTRLSIALVFAFLASGLFTGAVASPSSTWFHPGSPATGVPSATGASLALTWTNTSPLGFSASTCYVAGGNSVMCNATYWVNKDANGTCAANGTGQWISNVAISVSTKFYFAGASPILPSALTFCGGGSTANTIHFWFHVNVASGMIKGTAHVIAR